LPYPAKHVNLRGVEEEKYVLIDITAFERGGTAKLVEEIEISRALFEVYEGGVVRGPWSRRRNSTHLVSH
jgi:DEAD/DEAH box helicase domain-containing protein